MNSQAKDTMTDLMSKAGETMDKFSDSVGEMGQNMVDTGSTIMDDILSKPSSTSLVSFYDYYLKISKQNPVEYRSKIL